MTSDMTCNYIDIYRVKLICSFNVLYDNQLKEAFCWKNTQTLIKQDHQIKGTSLKFLEYQLHFIQAYQFINLSN